MIEMGFGFPFLLIVLVGVLLVDVLAGLIAYDKTKGPFPVFARTVVNRCCVDLLRTARRRRSWRESKRRAGPKTRRSNRSEKATSVP